MSRMQNMMVYGTKRIKRINMMLDALEQYYVNYNELQQITSQYSQAKHSLARGKGDR